jgi:hypothetical protein
VANLVFTKIPDCEALITDDMKVWFDGGTEAEGGGPKFTELFPKDTLKISTDHPFVALLQQKVPDGGTYSLSGFPCVTVIDMNFNKLVETPVAPQTMKILPAILDEIDAGGRNKFIMAKKTRLALGEAFKPLLALPVADQFLRAEGYQTMRRTQMAIEIWATNNVMKGKIFDLVTMYLTAQQRFKMHTEAEVMIEEESINGEKSGIYNFDFGETLYGGMIHFSCAYTVGYYIIKDFVIGAGVEVIENGMVE